MYLHQHPAWEQSKPCLAPRSSCKNSFPGGLGRGKLQSSPAPHPPKTPANTFCPPLSLPCPCEADFQQVQMQQLGSKLPPVLETRAVTRRGSASPVRMGFAVSQRTFCGCSAQQLTARGTVPHSQVIWIGTHQEVCFHLLCLCVGVQTVTSFSAASTPLNGDFHIHQAWKNIAIF